jgi:methyltransferase (TIGR00027 family)
MRLRCFSNSGGVAELRYIQSIHEQPELRNPDTMVRHFLPVRQRWRCAWLGRDDLAALRSDPFYYYLVARTKYYDELFLRAITDGARSILNIGCGTDTRAIRFADLLRDRGVKVLECDQAETISDKQRVVQRLGALDHVDYMSIDLNDDDWPDLDQWLSVNGRAKALVLLEGVSPYVNFEAFTSFLRFLARRLASHSRVAYDFKLRGVDDGFGRDGRTHRPFRLPAVAEDVAAHHEALGYGVKRVDWSSGLAARLPIGREPLEIPLFREDGLVQLEIAP